MNESKKFTPGPWFVIEDIRTEDGVEYIAGFNIQTEYGDELVGCEGIYGDFGGNRYNANLMAAAPDLLEALEKMIDEYGTAGDGWPRNNKALRDAREVISKARGQS